MEIILNVFLLENDKYFLYHNQKQNSDKIFIELELSHEYANINRPIEIIDSYDIYNITDIDMYVKEYMLQKGIDNVRGGSYCDVIIPEYKIKAIENEFKLINNDSIKKSIIINEIICKYENMNNEEREIELKILIEKLGEYQETKRLYDHYSKFYVNSKAIKVDNKLLNNFEWLNDSITYVDNNYCSPETMTIYKDTVLKLKCISKLFFERFPDYEFIPEVYYRNPDTVFDLVFLNKGIFNEWEQSLKLATEVYKTYEFMYYKLLNYVVELEFDLTTFPKDFEEEAIIAIKYLHI